jgi:hypothetical protein
LVYIFGERNKKECEYNVKGVLGSKISRVLFQTRGWNNTPLAPLFRGEEIGSVPFLVGRKMGVSSY